MSFDFSSRRRWHARRGATLLEQLIVIAIIGMLMAMLFVAVKVVLPTPPSLYTVVDKRTMEMAALLGEPLRIPAPPPPTSPREMEIIPDEYIIQFAPSVANPTAEANKVVGDFGTGRVLKVYDSPVLKGCHVYIPDVTEERVQAHPSVQQVGPENRVYLCADPPPTPTMKPAPAPGSQVTPTGVARIQDNAAANRAPLGLDPLTIGRPDLAPLPPGAIPVTGSLDPSILSQIVVAVIDTGCNTHQDLNVTNRPNLGLGNNDDVGHGTHLAGTIGAIEQVDPMPPPMPSTEIGVIGVAPGVEIWGLKALGPLGGTTSSVIEALLYVFNNAPQNGGQIDVCCMGFTCPFDPTLRDPPHPNLIVNALVDACSLAGVIMVAAAGNNSADAANTAPASARTVITVAAMRDTDGAPGGAAPEDAFAIFSNFGPRVDVIAPGVDICSTLPGNQYGVLSGTSAAAAHVAGVMALFRASEVNNPVPAFPPPRTTRRATGLEIVSLFVRNQRPELIFRGAEIYPLLLLPP